MKCFKEECGAEARLKVETASVTAVALYVSAVIDCCDGHHLRVGRKVDLMERRR